MSATLTPSIRSATALCTSAPRADWPSRNASSTSHSPPNAPRAEQHQVDAEAGEQRRRTRGPTWAAATVPRRLSPADAPDERPEDPPAVERERGHEVEDEHDRVHQQQPRQRQQHRGEAGPARRAGTRATAGSGPTIARSTAANSDHHAEGGQRPGGGDLQLLRRGPAVAGHLGQPAEQEQLDAAAPRFPARRATSAWPSSWTTSEPKNSSALITVVA